MYVIYIESVCTVFEEIDRKRGSKDFSNCAYTCLKSGGAIDRIEFLNLNFSCTIEGIALKHGTQKPSSRS